MTLFARPLEQRFTVALQQLQRDVTLLKTRTGVLDSSFPVACLPGVIDSGYRSGDPSVYLNGADSLSGPYQHLASYTPAAGDSVLLAPVGALQAYVILGRLA